MDGRRLLHTFLCALHCGDQNFDATDFYICQRYFHSWVIRGIGKVFLHSSSMIQNRNVLRSSPRFAHITHYTRTPLQFAACFQFYIAFKISSINRHTLGAAFFPFFIFNLLPAIYLIVRFFFCLFAWFAYHYDQFVCHFTFKLLWFSLSIIELSIRLCFPPSCASVSTVAAVSYNYILAHISFKTYTANVPFLASWETCVFFLQIIIFLQYFISLSPPKTYTRTY